MFWGRHTDVVVRALRPDNSLRFLLRQRQFSNPGPNNVVLEVQDKRTREEARKDWEETRAIKKMGVWQEAEKVTYVNGLPHGWGGLWKERVPRMAPPLVRLASRALENLETPYIDVIPYGRWKPSKRLASVYSEFDSVAFEGRFGFESENYVHFPAWCVSLQDTEHTLEYVRLARPVFPGGRGAVTEFSMVVTYV